ncbi:MAG: hypothetical protein O7A03_06835 [Alphaproteobacteria bacterium]|nr:hypothetical protein [Alphaproteobacteria bacterium]
MIARCTKCGEHTYLRPLHDAKGGPLLCPICAGKWHAKHNHTRKWERIIVKAMKHYQRAGGRWSDFDRMKLSVAAADLGFTLAGSEANTIGTEIGDITTELLTDAISLTHPDRHPPEREELARRVTQELVDLKPFAFPAPKPEPATAPPPRNGKDKGHSADTIEPLHKPDYPCELCIDEVFYNYCTACRADWEKRLAAKQERERERRRRWYANRRQRQIASRLPTKCAVCGEKFKAKRKDARYCSNVCRQQAHRQRKAVTKQPPIQ